eukprot:2463258-Rhodomonas_salina.1
MREERGERRDERRQCRQFVAIHAGSSLGASSGRSTTEQVQGVSPPSPSALYTTQYTFDSRTKNEE